MVSPSVATGLYPVVLVQSPSALLLSTDFDASGVLVSDPAAVLAHLSGRLGRYKWPARIVVWDALPRSGYGKVPKAEVKRLLAERGEA